MQNLLTGELSFAKGSAAFRAVRRIGVPPPRRRAKIRLMSSAYQSRVAAELSTFENCLEVHDLPAIFHYWSDGKIRPKLEAFGFSSPVGMFKKYLEELCAAESTHPLRFVSVGSGNCDLEIEFAQHLRSKGHSSFV